jgi:hypothetical protein
MDAMTTKKLYVFSSSASFVTVACPMTGSR